MLEVPRKRLDLQVLLDPLEEEFYLPTLFVNFCDLLGFQVVGIGDKAILNPSFRIGIGNQPKRGFNAFEFDGLVVGDTRAFSSGPFEQILDVSVALEPGDKVDRIYGEFVVPGIIGKSAVKADKGSFEA